MLPKFINYSRNSQEKKQKKVEFFNSISSFSESKRKAFLILLRWSYRYQMVNGSQLTLAQEVGVTRETINRWFKEFQVLGLIHKLYRHMSTCIYRIDNLFYDFSFRGLISRTFERRLLSVLFSISCLLSVFNKKGNTFQSEYVTHITNSSLSIYQSSRYLEKRNNNADERARGERPRLDDRLKDYENKKSLKRVGDMLPFTHDELEQLAHYPKEVLDHANKRLTKELHAGRHIVDQFRYFVAICENYKAPQTKTPQRERTGAPRVTSQWQQKSPAQESFDWLNRMYEMRQKMHDRGFKWRYGTGSIDTETYGDMTRILAGYAKGKPIDSTDVPPRRPDQSDYDRLVIEHEKMRVERENAPTREMKATDYLKEKKDVVNFW